MNAFATDYNEAFLQSTYQRSHESAAQNGIADYRGGEEYVCVLMNAECLDASFCILNHLLPTLNWKRSSLLLQIK